MKILFTDDYSNVSEDTKQAIKDYDLDDIENPTEDDIYWRWCVDLEFECEDLREILEKIDKDFIKNDLIAIADLGLWDGHQYGYKELQNLTDISTCMQDYNTLYIERSDLKIEAIHHDGTNYITIREFKDISDTQKENFIDKIYSGTATRKDISRYTKAIGKTVYDNFYL